MESNSIITFTENFFRNLKCTMTWEGKVLKVSNVPKSFEDFSGRAQPYFLVFSKEDEDEEHELLVKGSYFLRMMIEYLEGSGQTSLLKIVFDLDAGEKFGSEFNLLNSKISHITRKQEYEYIQRFTFVTSCQYLNEKENLTNSIFVKDGEVINLDIERLSTVEGRKEDISTTEMNEGLNAAKAELKSKTSGRIKELHDTLQAQINKEIERIKNHSQQQRKEFEDSKNKLLNQLKNLEKEKAKNPSDILIDGKIAKVNESIKAIENSDELNKINKEEEFFINDEIHKHGLSVGHKLMNMTLFYYPKYFFTIYLKSEQGGRIAEANYDPLFNEWSKMECNICNKEMKDIFLCAAGHLTCTQCGVICPSCGKDSCEKCGEKPCWSCGKECCRKCAVKCKKCGRNACSVHSFTEGISSLCSGCIKNCLVCMKRCDPAQMQKRGDGGLVCNNCHRKTMQDKMMSRVFDR